MKIRYFHILPYFLYPIALVFCLQMDEIPYNERILLIELEEGILDSLYWEELSPFYFQPLSVPFGELRYLYDLFPNLPKHLPLTSQKLEKYEPWTPENIDIFFEDYPFLLPFKALLSFNTNIKKSFGYIQFSSKITNYSSSYNPTVSINLKPFKNFNVEGKFTLDNNPITWQRRRLTFRLPYLGKIQTGNFNLVLNKGLFYGYFPKSKDTTNYIKKNWLYGESRTWNGITSKTPFGEKVILDIFFHKRKTESISGIKITYNPNLLFTFYGALSGSYLREYTKKDTTLSAHLGLLFKKKIISLSIESGVDLLKLNEIPFYSDIKFGQAGQKYTLTFLRIPERFSAPRSRILHSIYNNLEVNDSTKGVITMTSISSIRAMTDHIKQTASVSCIFTNYLSYLRVSFKFAVKKPFDYSLTYSIWSENGVNRIKQKIKFSHINWFTKYLGIASHMSLNFDQFDQMEYWRFLVNLRGNLKFFSTYSISPVVTYIVKNDKIRDFSIGLKQHLNLFEKTYGEFTLLFPIISRYLKNAYSIYATLNFLL